MEDDLPAAAHAIANAHSVALERVLALISDIREQAGQQRWYVFWFERDGAGSAGSTPARTRTLLAFATPDAALGFAQRHRLIAPGVRPRLRSLTIAHVLAALLRERQIAAVRLVDDTADEPPGQLPDGTILTRDDMLARLHGTASSP